MTIYKCDIKTGEVLERFASVKEICSTLSIQRSFNGVLNGNLRAYRGFLWCYESDYNEEWVKAHIDPDKFVPTPRKKSGKIIAFKANGAAQRFSTMKKAAAFFRCSPPYIRTLIEQHREIDGYTLEWD